jgi:hypothetical protein
MKMRSGRETLPLLIPNRPKEEIFSDLKCDCEYYNERRKGGNGKIMTANFQY